MTSPSDRDLDEKTGDAVRQDVNASGAPHERDPPLFDLMLESFRGRRRWVNAFAFLSSFAVLGLAIVAAYQFFLAESTRAMIAWATGFLWFVAWVAMLKVWFWLEIQKNSVTCEIRRLELQVANLSRQLGRET